MNALHRVSLVATVALCTTACRGVPLQLNDPLQANEVAVSEVEGSSTGIHLFGIIPIGLNQRFGVAHDRALAQAPGATRIANTTISENWFWAYILNGYTTTVRGTAVRPK